MVRSEKITEISSRMVSSGLDEDFVATVASLALSHEYVCTLMEMWFRQESPEQQEQVIEALQTEIDDLKDDG